MGMKKANSTTAEAPVAENQTAVAETVPATEKAVVDSGTKAAINRLQKKAEAPAASKYEGRDFAAEARGKTRCVQFEAALMSPAIAGMKFESMDQYLALCKQAAEFGTAYTFGDTK
jgi:hypothetical protein